MKLLYTTLLGSASAFVIQRDWSCPTLVNGCTKSYLVNSGTCDSVAAANGITTDEFFDLNPVIARPNCNNIYAGCSYCVAGDSSSSTNPPGCATNYNPKCDKFYELQPGDYCYSIVGRNSPLTLDQFYAYNPSIRNPSCDNLQVSCKYCVHVATSPQVPEPHQPNIKTDCKEYYQAVPGDYCYKIAQDKGIAVNDFINNNPAVGASCANMLPGYWYCLRV